MNKSRSSATACRPLLLLIASALSVSGMVAVAPPSYAASSSVTGISGVIYDTCHNHKFRYAIDPEKAAYDWSMEVRAFDPRGVEVSSEWLWKDEGDPSSGTAALQICSTERPGTWRLEAELNFYGGPYYDEILPRSSFNMRKARSRAAFSVNDATAQYNQRLRFTTRVTGEFPAGYFPLEYETPRLQKYTSSGWITIARATTNENGVARFSIIWKDRRKRSVRVVVAPGAPYATGISRVIVVS